MDLYWTTPVDSDVSDYLVQYSANSGETWVTFVDGTSTDTTATVTGLTNDTAYDFRVSAMNQAGTGTPSGTATLTAANAFILTAAGQGVEHQADGKIVIVGSESNGTDNDFSITRYNANGTLDTDFGTNGKVLTDFGNGSDTAGAVAIQADGRIVVFGKGYNGTDSDLATARYLADGTLDSSFSDDGKVLTDLGGNEGNQWSSTVEIQDDGKILVSENLRIVRYNSDGSLDASFGAGGIAAENGGGRDLVIDADGKILAVNRLSLSNGSDVRVIRLNTDGSPDSGFADNGATAFGGAGTQNGHNIALQTDGKVVIVGSDRTEMAVWRLTTEGALDTTFSEDGEVTIDIGCCSIDGYGMAIQDDGKIIAAGSGNNSAAGTTYDYGVIRLNTNGSLDTTFSGDGVALTDLTGSSDTPTDLRLDSNGKAVVIGLSGLIRYATNGSLDTL